jgi:hypothetical protein
MHEIIPGVEFMVVERFGLFFCAFLCLFVATKTHV